MTRYDSKMDQTELKPSQITKGQSLTRKKTPVNAKKDWISAPSLSSKNFNGLSVQPQKLKEFKSILNNSVPVLSTLELGNKIHDLEEALQESLEIYGKWNASKAFYSELETIRVSNSIFWSLTNKTGIGRMDCKGE